MRAPVLSRLLLCSASGLVAVAMPRGPTATLTLMTPGASFVDATDRISSAPRQGVADLEIDTGTSYQEIKGFGGAFNEKGWTALQLLPDSGAKVLSELFSPTGTARFTLCRVPVGSSDYAESSYSLNETPGDLAMKDFSLARS